MGVVIANSPGYLFISDIECVPEHNGDAVHHHGVGISVFAGVTKVDEMAASHFVAFGDRGLDHLQVFLEADRTAFFVFFVTGWTGVQLGIG